MKAAIINEFGDTGKIEITDIAKPAAAAGMVLVEVHAASLNPVDLSVLHGYMQQFVPLEMPVTLGIDFAGVVVGAGDGVSAYKTGDKVYGSASRMGGGSGAFAEFAAVHADRIAQAPVTVDFTAAASAVMAGVSALQALSDGLDVHKGQKVFIHGASGGIGTVAVQIAKHMGAYVAGSARGESCALVKELGADEVVDTTIRDYADILTDYDAVLDLVSDDAGKSMSILKPGGKFVTLLGKADDDAAKAKSITVTRQSTQVTTKRLDDLRLLIDGGAVSPFIGRLFSFDELKAAYQALEAKGVKGKIAIKLK